MRCWRRRGHPSIARPFLTAEWRDLVMLNYAVDPLLLRPFVPAGTELDSHDGRAFASVVAFRFWNTRVLGWPIPFHRNFLELNLRFYVRREAAGVVRRGVVFIREVVPRVAIAALARFIYNEPYVRLPMRSRADESSAAVRFQWYLGGRWQGVRASSGGDAVVPSPGSHEEFITDHAWGYTRQRDGGTVEYRVEHERWAVRKAHAVEVDADFDELYGPAFGAALKNPSSALVVDGSPVTVNRPTRLSL